MGETDLFQIDSPNLKHLLSQNHDVKGAKMKTYKTFVMVAVVAAAIAVMGAPQVALAAAIGTDAGVTVTNAVTVDYTVGGSGPFQLTASVDFVVDNHVDLIVDNQAAPATTGRPGATVYYEFTVRNDGNETQDYGLLAADATTQLAATANTGTSTWSYSEFVESNGTPGYQAGDTAVFIDDLPADATTTVYVVVVIDGGAVGSEYQNFSLTATTENSDGSGVTNEDPGADNPAVVQAVFADGAGSSDAANDGTYSALGAFEVVWTDLVVIKTSLIISDPINGPIDTVSVPPVYPKAIPQAVVQYTVTVTNNGNLPADGVNVVDTLPGELALILPVSTTPAADTDDSGNVANTVDVTLNTLGGSGATFEVVYTATIQ
jgi:uncharacterized repeat protein (TIGR01451 family)